VGLLGVLGLGTERRYAAELPMDAEIAVAARYLDAPAIRDAVMRINTVTGRGTAGAHRSGEPPHRRQNCSWISIKAR
jgi:hypothetical protein